MTLINICSCRKTLGTSSSHNPLSRAPGRESTGEEIRSVRGPKRPPRWSVVKTLPANAGDVRDSGSIPESGRSPGGGKIPWRREDPPGGGHGNLLQYSCLVNPLERETWWTSVPGVAKSGTQLKWLSTHTRRASKPLSIWVIHSRWYLDLIKSTPQKKIQIVTSFKHSLEELTRFTHSGTCGYGLLEWEATKHSQHWE